MLHQQSKKFIASLLTSTLLLSPLSILAEEIHTVTEGETLSSIAADNGVSVTDLIRWNGYADASLKPGVQLVVSDPQADDNEDEDNAVESSSTYHHSHTIQPGDTLEAIANAYGISVDQLYAWNGLSSDYLYVGDVIAVAPDGESSLTHTGANYSDYTVSAGKTGVYTGNQAGGHVHTVRSGDNLWDLAMAYGTTVDAIMAVNGLSSDYLDVGDQLTIPSDALYSNGYEGSVSSGQTGIGNAHTVTDNQTSSTGQKIHVVAPGDTLESIATAYGIPMSDLQQWNHLTSSEVQVGDRIALSPNGPVNEQHMITIMTADGESKLIDLSKIPESARPKTHVVQAGDNIWRIADQYHVSAESLRLWNQLTDGNDQLTIGQTIFVSTPAFVPDMVEAKDGDSVESIAQAGNITVENLLKWNNLNEDYKPKSGEILFVSNPKPLMHNVTPGETLESIAEKYHIEVDQLRTWNYLPENSRIINGTLIVSNPKEDVISSN